jgi:hypothetical protein
MTPSDFTTGATEIPAAPIDIPVPEIPNANFTTIGAQIGAGMAQAAAANAGKPGWFDWLADIVGSIVGFCLSLIEIVLAGILAVLNKIFANAEGGTDAIAAQAVAGLFGTSAVPGAFSSALDPSQREAVAAAIANQVMTQLTGGAAPNPAGGIQPGHSAQVGFLTTATHLTVEGFLQGLLGELASVGQLKSFMELKDSFARVLGMGRIAHTMLTPTIKVLVTDPALWELQANYRPQLWKEAEGTRAYNAGSLDIGTLKTQLSWQGYTDDQIADAIIRNTKNPAIAEIASLVRWGQLTQDDVSTQAGYLGYNDATASYALAVIENAELQRIEGETVAIAIAGFVDRKIQQSDLQTILSNTTLSDKVQAAWLTYAINKQSLNTKRVSTGEANTLVKQGIWGLDQWTNIYELEGYSESDIEDLQILVFAEEQAAVASAKAKATAAATRAAKAQAAATKLAAQQANAVNIAEAKGVSLAEYQTLVLDGLKTILDYQNFLTGKGLAPDIITDLVTLLQNKINAAGGAAAVAASAATGLKAKGLSLGQMEQAYLAGFISLSEYQAQLEGSGVTAEAVPILVELAQNKLSVQQAKQGILAGAATQAAQKGVSLGQELTAVKLGLVSIPDYQTFLQAHGFTDAAVAVLVSEAQNALAAAQSAAAIKGATAVGATGKGLSLAQLEKSVRAGFNTIGDYSAALQAAGYDAQAITALTGILQDLMANDARTNQTKAIASAAVSQTGVQLADLERGVRLGVVPMATYLAVLTSAGVPAAAQNILQLNLAAQIKSTNAAQGLAASIRKMVSATGLSLGTLEKNVYAGKLSVLQFTNEMIAAGVDPTDAQIMVNLVQDEYNQVNATAALEGAAEAAAAGKQLSLAEEKAAVNVGVKTLVDYSNFVSALGFNSADTATLVATLAGGTAYQKLVSAGTAPAYTG